VRCVRPTGALIWSVVRSSLPFTLGRVNVAWCLQVLLLDEVTVDLDVLGMDMKQQ
jgi:hypothetical protein